MPARKKGLPPKKRMRHDRHFVEELARISGEGIGKMIPVSMIVPNEEQPRSNLGDLSDLVESIERYGVLEPLLVRRLEGGGYQLVSGERRFHAALQAGLEEVPCIELDLDDVKALEVALIENLQRQDLDPFEEAEGYRKLVDKYGYTHEQVARAVGKSRVTVTETLALLRIPPELRDYCRHADIRAKGTLLEIAKASSPEEMLAMIEALREGLADREALRKARKSASAASAQQGPRTKPLRLRFSHPESGSTLSISLRTEGPHEDPEETTRRLVAALESLLEQLRSEGISALTPQKGPQKQQEK